MKKKYLASNRKTDQLNSPLRRVEKKCRRACSSVSKHRRARLGIVEPVPHTNRVENLEDISPPMLEECADETQQRILPLSHIHYPIGLFEL
jgi:hypothetical protein